MGGVPGEIISIGFCPLLFGFDVGEFILIGFCGGEFMLIGFCVTEFMLIGFCVRELLFIDVVLEGVDVEDVFEATDEFVGLDVEFVDDAGLDVEFVDDSESVLETAVSQLSSHEVALSIRDEEAVVPERAEIKKLKTFLFVL